MKKNLLFFLTILLCLSGFAQDVVKEPAKTAAKIKRFFVGVSYSYMSVDMKLAALSLHSVWYGNDLGTNEASDDEINQINDVVDRNSRINAICVQAGMSILDKPNIKWKLKGSLMLGIAENLTTVSNNSSGIKEYSFNSGFSKPCAGLGLDLGYQFNLHWGISLRPFALGTMGNSNTIVDKANSDPVNFDVLREDKYRSLYGRVSLFVTFTAGSVTVFAGPGFYRIWSHHIYKRELSQHDPGELITEEITTTIVPRNFIDGNLGASWRIIAPITLYAQAGFAGDFILNTGIHFNF
ncbi:MAG: hypothetical protein WCP32_07475 [Bacteroidota bacterium]